MKRSLVATLPRTLIVHLARLAVDWNAGGVARKINDEIRFDHLLDMEPYTIAGQRKAEARLAAAARERKEANAANGDDANNDDGPPGSANGAPNGDGGESKDGDVQLPNGMVGENGESSVPATVTDSDCMYELVGVLTHNGAASRGHYYSFIKDRRPDAGTSLITKFDRILLVLIDFLFVYRWSMVSI
jgi:hypothetical protein